MTCTCVLFPEHLHPGGYHLQDVTVGVPPGVFFQSAHKLDITCPEPGMRLVTETELVDNAFKISWHSVGPEDWEVNVPVTLSLGDQEADDLTCVYPEDVRWTP